MKALPNLLSLIRLVCAPALVALALEGARGWFLALLAGALLTDVLDGALARWLQAESELGRRLDSLGDYTTIGALALGLWLLWPELMRREWPWFAAGIAGYFAVIVYGLARWRHSPGYHTWMSKGLALALPVALALLLTGVAAWPFRFVMAGQVIGGLEELAIALLLAEYSGQMPSLWHAWRRKNSPRDESRQLAD